MTLVLAHAGHLLVDIPLFLGPVVLLGVALAVSTRRERRRGGGGGAGGSGGSASR